MSKKLSAEQIQEVIGLYTGGQNAYSLSKIYPVTPTSIYALLKRRGIDRRTLSEASRRYTLNVNYFNIIDTPNKAYFLGFIMADGYNNEARGVLELGCAEKDKEILEKLNHLIGSSKPVRHVDSKGIKSCRIDWCSKVISNDLVKLGCMQNKTFKLKFPTIDDNLVRHFIRGYFDGDGCISYTCSPRDNSFGDSFNVVITIVSTEDFCSYLKKYIRKNFEIHSTILCRNPSHNNNNRTLQISGSNQMIKLMSWMYEGAETFLQRKMDKFLEFRNKLESRKQKLKEIKDNRPPRIMIQSVVKSRTEHWNARYFITHGIVKHEGKSFFTEEQAVILRKKLDEFGDKLAIPQDLIDKEFKVARDNSFPYYDLSLEYRNKRLKSMSDFDPKLEDGFYKWDGLGTELANYFHPQMFDCRKKGKMSPIEFFNSDEDLRRGIWKLIALYPKLTPSNIREICCNETATSRINNFPPRVMMTILKHLYNNQKITMLDPCAGFSGRLLGCFGSKVVKKYIGIDLSELTYRGLSKTSEWLRGTNENTDFESNIIYGNYLDVVDKISNVDFVFTSPPFLDEEKYMGVEVETDYNKWKDIFIEPFITKMYGTLKSGGKLAVYTEAIRRNDFPVDFCNIASGVGFSRLDDINFHMPARESLRKNRTSRVVKVVVFEKR